MRPLLLFYLLVVYVLLQFSWWSYLLIELNKEVYLQKIELMNITDASPSAEKELYFSKQLKERWLMVAGEGFVFITILIFGIFKTRDAFRKEFALAGQQKNFLLSITHEFKSPLAAVKLNLQTIQKRELDKTQRNSMIAMALTETDRINNLIENALLAARIESHSFNMHLEEFNLTDCISSTIQSRMIPGSEKTNVTTHLENGIYMKGDALAISSLILNLLENAEKYSPENAEITIKLEKIKNSAVISIADSGIGIPDSEKVKIFDKFYRIGNEETRNAKGTGLGLFIVKHIVDFHHGDIKVANNHPQGTIFQVTLPAQ